MGRYSFLLAFPSKVVPGPYFKSFSGVQDQSKYLLQSMTILCNLMPFDSHSNVILNKPLIKDSRAWKNPPETTFSFWTYLRFSCIEHTQKNQGIILDGGNVFWHVHVICLPASRGRTKEVVHLWLCKQQNLAVSGCLCSHCKDLVVLYWTGPWVMAGHPSFWWGY